MELSDTIRAAKNALGLPEETPSKAYKVKRADRASDWYSLVIFGEPERTAAALAIVNVETGDVESWVRGGVTPIAVESDAAARLAGAPDAEVELVWRPGRVSKSPFYPFWAVHSQQGTRYVDQQGNVWDEM